MVWSIGLLRLIATKSGSAKAIQNWRVTGTNTHSELAGQEPFVLIWILFMHACVYIGFVLFCIWYRCSYPWTCKIGFFLQNTWNSIFISQSNLLHTNFYCKKYQLVMMKGYRGGEIERHWERSCERDRRIKALLRLFHVKSLQTWIMYVSVCTRDARHWNLITESFPPRCDREQQRQQQHQQQQ